MRFVPLLLPFLSGCFLLSPTFTKPPPPGEVVEEVPSAPDRAIWLADKEAPVGSWATYSFMHAPNTIVLVRKLENEYWVEIRDKPKYFQRIAWDGRVLESHVVVGGIPQKQRLEQMAPPDLPPDDATVETSSGRTTIGGKQITVQQIDLNWFSIDGRKTTRTFRFSEDVPPLNTSTGIQAVDRLSRGGLVSGVSSLVDFGSGMKPSLEKMPWE